MKAFFLRGWIMFSAGLLLGILLFFPINQVKEKIFSFVSKTSGAQLQAESMNFGTGLGMGLSKGGVFALKFKKLRVQSGATTIDCDDATISPHFLRLFVGHLALGISCSAAKLGAVDAKIVLRPFWSPTILNLDANFKGFNTGALAYSMPSYPIKALVYGDLTIDGMDLEARGVPPLSWNLSMQKVVLPSMTSDFLNLPEISLGTLDTKGSLKDGKLLMEPLNMGNSTSPLSAELSINLLVNSQMVPSSGEIKGKLTADPKWESKIKDTLDLGLLFGTPDASGVRKFRKVIEGGPMSLLNPPLPY